MIVVIGLFGRGLNSRTGQRLVAKIGETGARIVYLIVGALAIAAVLLGYL